MVWLAHYVINDKEVSIVPRRGNKYCILCRGYKSPHFNHSSKSKWCISDYSNVEYSLGDTDDLNALFAAYFDEVKYMTNMFLSHFDRPGKDVRYVV